MEKTIKTVNYLVNERKMGVPLTVNNANHIMTTENFKSIKNKNIMILFDDDARKEDIESALDSVPVVTSSYQNIPVVNAEASAKQLAALKHMPGVSAVEDADMPVNALDTEKNSQYSRPKKDRFTKAREREPTWNMTNVQAPDAWEKTKDGMGVYVAVIDTGVDYNHPDLKARFGKLKGYNAIAATDAERTGKPLKEVRKLVDDPMDDHGHGTHCSGIIAANGTQDHGNIKGVARKCNIYAVKVLDATGSGTLQNVCKGIDWASGKEGRRGTDVKVISMSLGTSSYSAILDKSVQAAIDKGVTVVAAAGNSSRGYSYPASFDRVVSVAAVDKDNKHAYFSNVNDKLSLSAPGVDVMSTFKGGLYRSMSGTSMACPHVAGGAAVYLSEFPKASPAGVRNALMDSSKNLGDKTQYGSGILQTYDLVKLGARYRKG